MTSAAKTAAWIKAHEGIALGRLLTAARHAQTAAAELNRLIGYLDSDDPNLRRLELGIEETTSQLLKVTRALDMVPDEKPTPVERPARCGHIWVGAHESDPGHGPCTLNKGHAGPHKE